MAYIKCPGCNRDVDQNKYEDMLKFLNQKYEIENFGWKNIFRE